MIRHCIVIFVLLFACAVDIQAQSCYSETRYKGVQSMARKEYDAAIDYFTAAQDCPDKPVDNDLTTKIQQCRTAKAEIKRKAEDEARARREQQEAREREERERRERERQQRQRQEQEYAQSGYMKIHRIEFANYDKTGNMITDFNQPLYKDVKYVKPRISYDGLLSTSKKITLFVKIITSDGSLKRGQNSPEGYTFSQDVTINTGSGNSMKLLGWGNESGTAYSVGTHKWELWFDGHRIYSQTFEINARTTSTTLTVDGKNAVTSSFSETGGEETFYVNTDASEWKTWGVPSWCEVVKKTSSSFTIKCEPNNTNSSRTDYMKVKTENQEVRIDFTQKGLSKGASFTNVWVNYDVFEGYPAQKGMRINMNFSVWGMKSKSIEVSAYFYSEDGQVLKDYNGLYKTGDGQVSVGKNDTSPYERTDFSNFTLFMPYNELHMARGSHNLKFYVIIWDTTGINAVRLGESDYVSFSYSQSL